jgi:hypothetical protein
MPNTAGRPRTCDCGECHKCKTRINQERWRAKQGCAPRGHKVEARRDLDEIAREWLNKIGHGR